ncbi:hypothetical protein PCE1_003243 [Barthelona sp. PCE]
MPRTARSSRSTREEFSKLGQVSTELQQNLEETLKKPLRLPTLMISAPKPKNNFQTRKQIRKVIKNRAPKTPNNELNFSKKKLDSLLTMSGKEKQASNMGSRLARFRYACMEDIPDLEPSKSPKKPARRSFRRKKRKQDVPKVPDIKIRLEKPASVFPSYVPSPIQSPRALRQLDNTDDFEKPEIRFFTDSPPAVAYPQRKKPSIPQLRLSHSPKMKERRYKNVSSLFIDDPGMLSHQLGYAPKNGFQSSFSPRTQRKKIQHEEPEVSNVTVVASKINELLSVRI